MIEGACSCKTAAALEKEEGRSQWLVGQITDLQGLESGLQATCLTPLALNLKNLIALQKLERMDSINIFLAISTIF